MRLWSACGLSDSASASTRTGRVTLQIVGRSARRHRGHRRHHPDPVPRPGWLIVLAGLAVWAVEFAWARGCSRSPRAGSKVGGTGSAAEHWAVRVIVAGLVGLVFVASVVYTTLYFSSALGII